MGWSTPCSGCGLDAPLTISRSHGRQRLRIIDHARPREGFTVEDTRRARAKGHSAYLLTVERCPMAYRFVNAKMEVKGLPELKDDDPTPVWWPYDRPDPRAGSVPHQRSAGFNNSRPSSCRNCGVFHKDGSKAQAKCSKDWGRQAAIIKGGA